MPTLWISACDGGVGEHERAGERLGELRVALQAAGGALASTLMTRSAAVSPADRACRASDGLGALELALQGGDEQVDLGGEVAVERAEGDVGLLGDGAHLDGVEAALRGERDRGVEDPLAAVALRGRAEILDRQGVGAAHTDPHGALSRRERRRPAESSDRPSVPLVSGSLG